MQAKAFATLAALAAVASSAVAAPATPGPVPSFTVTDFRTVCSDSASEDCTSSFTLAVNAYPATDCSIKWNTGSYIFCGTIDPEQAYYAYIEKSTSDKYDETLYAKFTSSFAGGSTDSILGNTSLYNKGSNFTFAASSGTSS